MPRKKVEKVKVNNNWQKNYSYELVEAIGKNFASNFKPDLTPQEMLKLGVFDGHYLSKQEKEYPVSWFREAKLSDKPEVGLNYFKVHASQPYRIWQEKGWIYKDDPRGWFEWYCRYYMGRRIQGEDARQIKRWRTMRRHVAQIIKNCRRGDYNCRRKQRQALLHWAYDSRKM